MTPGPSGTGDMCKGRASTIRNLASLARQIKEEARANPNSPYKGKLVGIADGRVVAVGDNLGEVVRDLRRGGPIPGKCSAWKPAWTTTRSWTSGASADAPRPLAPRARPAGRLGGPDPGGPGWHGSLHLNRDPGLVNLYNRA